MTGNNIENTRAQVYVLHGILNVACLHRDYSFGLINTKTINPSCWIGYLVTWFGPTDIWIYAKPENHRYDDDSAEWKNKMSSLEPAQ